MRCLEIGPGKRRIEGFETLDVVKGKHVDHVGDARGLPFPDARFDLIYASHVIEHIPWYETAATLREWVRVLTPGGTLELWTVDALFIARALVEYEETSEWLGPKLGPGSWKDAWIQANPYLWMAGRIFAYSKSGTAGDPFWHRAWFTPRSLASAMTHAGLVDVQPLDRSQVRGKDHGIINLGMRGVKPTRPCAITRVACVSTSSSPATTETSRA